MRVNLAAALHRATENIERPLVLPTLRVRTAAELLAMHIPRREMVLGPWLPEKGLAMIYSPRGLGKTWLAMASAYASAAGAPFLTFTAPTPRRVLFIDGEMPLAAMQDRFAQIIASFEKEAAPDNFQLLSADDQEFGLPDLSTAEGQAALEPLLNGVELVVLDNISTLCRTGRENEAESWTPVQDWALAQRRAGRSVLFVHHAGKGGAQRGTSRREDVLDTVISLKRPTDYTAEQGARFEIHFEKARGFMGPEAQPFEAMCQPRDGRTLWTTRTLADADLDRVVELKSDGLSVRDIATETGLSKSRVQRLVDRAKEAGRIDG